MQDNDPSAIQVLLVSSHLETIETFCHIIPKMAVHIETCSDYGAATKKMCRSKFDGIIVDLADEKKGLELLSKLRTGVVSYAILGKSHQRSAAFTGGANFVFDQPLSPALIARTLKASYPLLVRERRRYFRYPMQCTVHVQSGSDPEFTATTVNISESGIALVSPVQLEVGQKLRLRLRLPGKTEYDAVSADVCWTTAERAGLKFVSLSRRFAEELQAWLAERLLSMLHTQKERLNSVAESRKTAVEA